MSLAEYRNFISSRAIAPQMSGFDHSPINDKAKAHQVTALEFALNKGKSAMFLDTGLGKSFIELEFARQCAEETGKPSLILTPLAVAGQMVREGIKFGIDARQIKEQDEVGAGVMVANYERLPKLNAGSFGAIILDESSILKSFAGRTRMMLMDAFNATPYKMAATATPSPNDHMELGNHAEFLGVMRQQEMLSKWFINDTSTASQDWRLKGHAVEDFWQWVASWSRCATLPSDLGGDDTGYILPDVLRTLHTIEADRTQDTQGNLFRIPELSATSFHAEKKLTLRQRCEQTISLVFSDFRTKLAETDSGDVECLGSQNTQQQESKDTTTTKRSVNAESHKEDHQKKTQNTCENTTSPIQKNLQILKSVGTGITQAEGLSMPVTKNTLQGCEHPQAQGVQHQRETAGLNPRTELPKMTMKECFKIRDHLVQYVEKSTGKKEGKSCTSITAISQEKSGSCYAQHVTQPLGKCGTTSESSSRQSSIWSAITNDPWLIYCETNDEQDALEKAFGSLAFSVRGSDKPEDKEGRILAWCDGERPILISKTKIVGFGMNFQHCRNVVFASVNFSYESFYQGVRRVWRFGQDRQVHLHIVIADTEGAIWQAIHGKAAKHDEMKRRMSEAMKRAQNQADVRVKYDRPIDLAFPSWLKSEEKA